MPLALADAVYGLVGVAIGSGGMGSAWLAGRSKRADQAQALFDKIMEGVRTENADLREEVEACKKRDARSQAIEVVVRLTLTELRALAPQSSALLLACQLLKAFPVPDHQSPDEWKELLGRVSDAVPDYVAPERGPE